MRRSRARSVVLTAGAALAVGLALAGCGGTPLAQPAPDASSASPSSSSAVYADPGQLWPDPARTVTTTTHGARPPAGPPNEWELADAQATAEAEGVPVEEVLRRSQDQELLRVFFDQAKALLGDRWTRGSMGLDDELPNAAFTGDVPPELVALAEQLPVPVELRGGALLSEVEGDRARRAGDDVLSAAVPDGVGYGGGLDDPTATFTYGGFAAELWTPTDDLRQAMAAAAQQAVGRPVPFTVHLQVDDRDPKTTEPAFWYLPAGWVADPTATSIEVVVDSPQCASGVGPGERMAPPQVEVTNTEVRIAVSTYIRKGPQFCPGHGTAPLLVDLGKPLGDRTLVDVNGALRGDGAGPGGGLVTPAAG